MTPMVLIYRGLTVHGSCFLDVRERGVMLDIKKV
jgi:hypothetical protein